MHRRSHADGIEQRPVALLDQMPLREGRPWLLAKRTHHPIVAVITKQHQPDQYGKGRTALFTKLGGHFDAALRLEVGERAARKPSEMRQCLAYILAIAGKAAENVSENSLVIGARHAVC